MLCENCKQREATKHWVREGGTLAYIYEMYLNWCDLCVAEAMLAYASKVAASIPQLQERVNQLKGTSD